MSDSGSQFSIKQWALAAPVALLAVPALLVFFQELFVSYGIYDEGLILYGAQRVADGAVPYRDFWTLYAPGQFYLLAGLFQLFGTSIAVERVWSAVVVLVNVGLVAALVRRSTGPVFAVLAGSLAAAWLARTPMPGSPLPVALALALGSLFLLERALSDASQRKLFAAACLAGLTALFRHDLAALLCTAQLLRLAWARGPWLPYALGILTPTLPVAALLVAAVPLDTLIDSLVIFPATVFPAHRRLPAPAFDWAGLAFYGAPALLALGIVRVALQWRARARLDSAWCMALAFGLLLLQQAFVRSDVNHMLPSMLLAIAVACGMAEDLARRSRPSFATKLLAGLAAGGLIAVIGPALLAPLDALPDSATQPLAESQLPRAAGIRIPPAKQRYEAVVQYVRDRVPESQAIFVGNTRHDRLLFNDVMFYFLAERDSATAYHELHPGAATESAVQQQIVRELAGVETVVLTNIQSDEPNRSSQSSGVTLLDDNIRANFEGLHRAAGYQVLRRR